MMELSKMRYDHERHRMTRCQDYDGECAWEGCPQVRDGEPEKTGRHCPLDHWEALPLNIEVDVMDPKREAAIETARAMTDVIFDETLSIFEKNERLEALGEEFRKKRREIEGGDPPGRGFTAAIGNNTMENKLVMGEGLASLLESKHACLKIEIVDGLTTGEEESNRGLQPAPQTGP